MLNEQNEDSDDVSQGAEDLSFLDGLAELQDKPEGSKARIGIEVERTKNGFVVNNAQFIADVGKKSKDEFMKMDSDKREQYQRQSVMGPGMMEE